MNAALMFDDLDDSLKHTVETSAPPRPALRLAIPRSAPVPSNIEAPDFDLDDIESWQKPAAPTIPMSSRTHRTWPRITLRDTGVELVVSVDLPGVAIEDVDVQVSPELLTIRVRETVAVPKDCTIVKKERITGALERTLKLLTRVKPESVQASMELGVLTILLGKARKSSRQMIAVRGG
jgi:HSP20 family molecular chaperone IbpA